jgi:bifunctional non-homologous end joining protein LigD
MQYGMMLSRLERAVRLREHNLTTDKKTIVEIDGRKITLTEAKLGFIPPMLLKLASKLPEGPKWQYEIKLDGYRSIIVKNENVVTVFSRNGRPLNARFPKIASAFKALPTQTVLDGELVALDAQGRPNFNKLQNAKAHNDGSLYFYIFDVLTYLGRDLRGLPLSERRRILEAIASDLPDPVRLSPKFEAPAKDLLRAAREQQLEGIIAKRTDSSYRPGLRSDSWVKIKTAQGQELVIGGYLPGPHGFDSLLVGYYERNKLRFLGKVRNGFTPALRRNIATNFGGLETGKCPFDNLPESRNARRGKALTKDVMKECRWLKPQLVAQVAFTDWTEANHLRHAKFLGLREDKYPLDVKKESST